MTSIMCLVGREQLELSVLELMMSDVAYSFLAITSINQMAKCNNDLLLTPYIAFTI